MVARRLGLALCLGCLGASALAAEPEVDPKDLPRIPPVEPDKALATFRIKPGFRLELVAAEPLVVDPIAMAFDENGRLFVVEIRDYPEQRDAKLGRIRLLEDTDGDGRFDKSTVFADHLPWPTAVICYDGGVFVGATPDILYFKDTDGDGVADERKVVFTGFGQGLDKLNVQQLLNGFTWGLDNRIHGAAGGNGGAIASPRAPAAKPLELRGRDFSFDPRALDLRAESGGGQYGLSFDNHGRKFVCSNSSHIQTLMYAEGYAARNPFYAMPRPLVEIAVDGPAAEVYRISPDEPWRVIRTKWRVAGQVPGPIEGGGRPSGYFTAATGITIYRGNAWPEDFVGDVFVADCGSNLVHRKKLHPDGPGLKAERPAGEEKVEFLASTDNWFRPVQLANGPDGALYVADMYREVIEHPWSLPESIKKHLDLTSGNDRGRIYRIVPENFRQPKPPRLGQATVAELVKTLEHPNGWHRDTAARLLYQRADSSAVPRLAKLLKNSKSPLGRLHALYALEGQSALKPDHLTLALTDVDEHVRQHAVRLSETILMARSSAVGPVQEKLLALAADPSPLVRYQLAWTLGEVNGPGKLNALAELVGRDVESPWMQAAVLSSLGGAQDARAPSPAARLFEIVSGDARVRGQAGRDFTSELVRLIGAQNHREEIVSVLQRLNPASEPEKAFSYLTALGEGVQRAGGSLASATPREALQPFFQQASRLAADDLQPERLRVKAAQLLGLGRYADASSNLFPLLDPKPPQAVQLAALASLARFTEPGLAGELVKRWAEWTPRLRTEVLAILLRRPDRTPALLQAIESGQVRAAELSASQINFLRSHRDRDLRERAVRIFGEGAKTSRQQIIDSFTSALNLAGDAAGGLKIYIERCASCHRAAGQGHPLGPDLVTVKTSGKEKLLVNILDPNREVAPQYLSYLVETKTGEALTGIIVNETAASVSVRQANGIETVVLRSNLARIQSQGQSAMPEGLEAGLRPQEMADLLEFIASAGP